jgi:hypothetical protein
VTPDIDDSVSVSEPSPGSARIRRTEAERMQLLKDHVECGEMEPHRVFCTRCDQWVNLGKQQTYALRPWEKHRTRCDQKHPAEVLYVIHLLNAKMADLFSTVVTESRLDLQKMKMMTMPLLQLLRLHVPKDLYGGVNRKGWLSLSWIPTPKSSRPIKCCARPAASGSSCRPNRDTPSTIGKPTNGGVLGLCTYFWIHAHSHVNVCSCFICSPSSRVATAERKLKLVNDPQAMSSSSHSVECSLCRGHISLGHEGEYDLTNWNVHKLRCPR